MTALAVDAGRGRSRRSAQKARVYVLVDVAGGCHEDLASALRNKPGVVMADCVEGEQKVIMVVEAQDRPRLAELTVRALESAETAIEGIHLMPVEDHQISKKQG